MAAETNLSDRFYDAIRRDDATAVQQLLASGASANVKDSKGDTPLMYATASGSEAMMRRLIDAGAEVNAHNAFDATALLFCGNSLSRVKLLVEHGADVNVRSKQGHTPIELAAAHAGGLEVVKYLLAKGANLQVPPDKQGITPIAAASKVNDGAIVKFLLEKDAKGVLAGPGGPMALMNAAAFGNTELVKLLLAKGVDVNSQSPPESEDRVKNGPIALGNLTALLLASGAGNPETVRVLLDAGAKVDTVDVRGMTPLMLAIATDHPSADIVRMLLARHADTKIKSKAGETALDWALKFRNPPILAAVREASAGVEPAAVQTPPAPRGAPDIRTALERSTPLLQTSSTTTFREGGCVSCHGGNAVTSAVAAARRAGIRVDESAAAESLKATRLQFAATAEGLLERSDAPVPLIVTYALYAMAEENAPADRVTDAMAHNIAGLQLADGAWEHNGVLRPPTMDSIATAAYSIRAFQKYAPPARRAEYDERIARAARALSASEPSTTEDSVLQLLGLKWAGADNARLEKLAKQLAARQRQDGGWSQTPYLASDAYATGTVLHALRQAGMSAESPAYKKGVAFLLKTQAADGSWYVASRAAKFQPYFEGGFPYGHDQWISQWATSWATVALSDALPAQRASASGR